MNYNEKDIREFLSESNKIEREYSEQAFEDAILAWKYAYKYAIPFKIKGLQSTKYILKIHRLLCQNIRPDIAGKYRDCDVWIGGEIKRFISRKFLEDVTQGWINTIDINQTKKLTKKKKEEKVKEWHIGFEKLHPFEDGNGRTGRILYNIHRLLLDLPIHIIHTGDEQLNYYRWFK